MRDEKKRKREIEEQRREDENERRKESSTASKKKATESAAATKSKEKEDASVVAKAEEAVVSANEVPMREVTQYLRFKEQRSSFAYYRLPVMMFSIYQAFRCASCVHVFIWGRAEGRPCCEDGDTSNNSNDLSNYNDNNSNSDINSGDVPNQPTLSIFWYFSGSRGGVGGGGSEHCYYSAVEQCSYSAVEPYSYSAVEPYYYSAVTQAQGREWRRAGRVRSHATTVR